MGGKANLYNLGSQGIDLTKSPFHADDGSLVSAQNAVPDIRNEAGALTKRDGLVAVNSTALAGTIKGAVFAALMNLSGSLDTARRVYVAVNDASTGVGWYHSTDSFVTVAVSSGISAPYYTSGGFAIQDLPRAVAITNKLYYAGNKTFNYTEPPTIRVSDGTVDREVARLQPNLDIPANAFPSEILAMLAVGTDIYMSVHDAGTSTADFQGTVIRLSTLTGVLTRIGDTFPTGKLPGSLTWHLGRLWVGTTAYTAATTSKAYFIRPGIDTVWTEDETFAAATSGHVAAIADFRGSLYAAVDGAVNTATSTVYVRSPANAAWSSSTTDASSMYSSMVVFQNNLYASIYGLAAATTPEVRKFDGSSWSTVFTGTASAPLKVFKDKDTLYAFDHVNRRVYVSTDGTSWSSLRTSNSASNSYGTFAGISV